MKVEVLQSNLQYFNSLDVHYAIMGLENQFLVFLRVAVYTGFTVVLVSPL